MATLFNQTNLSPGTSFAGTQGTGSVTLGQITLSGAGSSLFIQPSNEIFLGDGAGGTAFYNISTISYANTTGTTNFLTTNVSTIALANISSLQSGAFTVNAQKMFSSLIGLNYA